MYRNVILQVWWKRKRNAYGKTYQTIKSLAQAYEVDYEHLCRLLRNEWNIDDAMKICRDKIYGSGKLCEYEGKVYRSPKRLAETYGLPW